MFSSCIDKSSKAIDSQQAADWATFLWWQNLSGEAAKSVEREREETPAPPSPSGKAGGASERQL